jgi:BirA family biotin operon repressor/biotin-[acetyl-CoA-carboxylase] ligase
MPFDIEAVRAKAPAHKFYYFESVGSTMVEAARCVAADDPHGTVVLAQEQTAGIGRLGRTWISESSVGIYCSVLLRLQLPPAQLPIASLLVGLAVAEAIEKVTGLACDLRWPNDVLIREKKVSGILTQLVDSCVIAGIGLNVSQKAFETGLRTPATSLLLESGGIVYSRESLVLALVEALDFFCQTLKEQGTDAILRAFAAHSSYVAGRRVKVEEGDLLGITAGLDEHGFLQLRTDAGALMRLSAGGIRPIKE